MKESNQGGELRRDLTLLDAAMINVGVIIGSGIFFVPNSVAGHIGTPWLYLGVWVLGGMLSLFGALAFAELGAARPRAGGQYVYLKEAFGPACGFLYGWTSFSVFNSASIAAVAVAFATYGGHFLPMGPWTVKAVAIALIAFLTAMNCLGVKTGAWIQNGFTFAKLLPIVALILLSFALGSGTFEHFRSEPTVTRDAGFIAPLGLAMIAVLWSYDGWVEITYAAGEVRKPERNLPRALLYSTLIVIAVYLLFNSAFIYVLGMEGMAASERVASDAAEIVLGPWGAAAITGTVLVATFGACNGFILGAARVYYAMGRDRLFFKRFAGVHPVYRTPAFSLVAQGVWASVLVLSGTFEELFTYVVFAGWLFYALTVAGVFVMRLRHPEMPRPYRTWGYPWTPVLFIFFAGCLVANTIVEQPGSAAIGGILILSGLPAYFFLRGRREQA